MKLMKALIWPCSDYIWSRRIDSEEIRRNRQAVEMYVVLYRRMLRINWMEKRTNKNIYCMMNFKQGANPFPNYQKKNGFLNVRAETI